MIKSRLAIATAGLSVGVAAWMFNTTYTVGRVIDGDTFVTAEKQVIRLANVSAPELQYCGGTEAKLALEKLIFGKKLHLKVIFNDRFKRLVSLVYTDDGFVNKQMLESGWTYLERVDGGDTQDLLSVTQQARVQSKGIFSDTCTQDHNLKKPKCNIKANIGRSDNIYHYPGCGQYNNVKVQLYLGDQWFCTKTEAEKAGFRQADLCP